MGKPISTVSMTRNPFSELLVFLRCRRERARAGSSTRVPITTSRLPAGPLVPTYRRDPSELTRTHCVLSRSIRDVDHLDLVRLGVDDRDVSGMSAVAACVDVPAVGAHRAGR